MDYISEIENNNQILNLLIDIEQGLISLEDAVSQNIDLLKAMKSENEVAGSVYAAILLDHAGIEQMTEVIRLPEPAVNQKNSIINNNPAVAAKYDNIINVYPNPTAGNIYVEYAFLNNSDNGFIEIYGITGNLVYRTELSQPIGVFTYKEKLPSGNYIIKVGNNFSKKITVQ